MRARRVGESLYVGLMAAAFAGGCSAPVMMEPDASDDRPATWDAGAVVDIVRPDGGQPSVDGDEPRADGAMRDGAAPDDFDAPASDAAPGDAGVAVDARVDTSTPPTDARSTVDAAIDARCTPSCAGRVCGPNGCGGSCGTCPAGRACNAAGACVTSCTPSCTGRRCGSDGCGGACGACPANSTCTAAGDTCQCNAGFYPNPARTACIGTTGSCAGTGVSASGYCADASTWIWCDPVYGLRRLDCAAAGLGACSTPPGGGGAGACNCVGPRSVVTTTGQCGTIGGPPYYDGIYRCLAAFGVIYPVNCRDGNPSGYCATFATAAGSGPSCMCGPCNSYDTTRRVCLGSPCPGSCLTTPGSMTTPSIHSCG